MTHAADIRAHGGEGKDHLRVQAIEAAMSIIARQGLAALSIRDLAQAIGKSATVIVNLFQTKAGLLSAVAEAGLEADAAFHERFLAESAGAPLNRSTLRALIVRYINRRAAPASVFARVWEEYLTDREACAAAGAQLQAWASMRDAAWAELLGRAPALASLGPVLFPYLVMEELYASALVNRLDYELLLEESADGLAAHALKAPPETTPVLDWVAEELTPPQPPGKRHAGEVMKLRLLDIAADLIMDGGIGAVTNRSVTQHARASTSTILYHFGDMRSFLAEAIWHSVFREIPAYLDARRPLDHHRPADLNAWAKLMSATLSLGPPGTETGFYVKYARLIAQICLLARRDAAFQDLAALLRGPEGGGTYARREANWPPQFALTRQSAAHFAIWIKGRSLLNAAIAPAEAADPDAQLRIAALALAPSA